VLAARPTSRKLHDCHYDEEQHHREQGRCEIEPFRQRLAEIHGTHTTITLQRTARIRSKPPTQPVS
jgi:hypothetical protein